MYYCIISCLHLLQRASTVRNSSPAYWKDVKDILVKRVHRVHQILEQDLEVDRYVLNMYSCTSSIKSDLSCDYFGEKPIMCKLDPHRGVKCCIVTAE